MIAKLNHLRQTVMVEDTSTIPDDLASESRKAIVHIIELEDIHRLNGDAGWFLDLVQHLVDDHQTDIEGTQDTTD
ncbi:MAG: hypothetical protein ACYC26_16670 [Phycisphaerales bacterium]